jgi:hypothetical protein
MLCGRFFPALLEPAMTKLLVAVLITACTVNVACLFSHLQAVAPDGDQEPSAVRFMVALSRTSAVDSSNSFR